MRYAYSSEDAEELDKDETLTLLKPAQVGSKDGWKPEGNGLSHDNNDGAGEEKTA